MASETRRDSAHITSRNSSMLLISIVSLTCLVTMATGSESLGQADFRLKRNVFQLCWVVTKHADRLCVYYLNYGCYCGIHTTSNVEPLDDVDKCCRLHDNCYDTLSKFCSFWGPQFVTYNYDCKDDNCTCTDSPTKNECKYRTCQCDVLFGQCLVNTSYNSAHYSIDEKEKRCHHP